MQVGCETAEPSHRFYISVQRYRHVVFRTSYVNPRCMQIQRWKSLGCICFRSLHPSFACQTALPYRRLPKVKFDGLGPVANRFYETLQRGRANRPKPIDCHQITDRQKPEPYSETGTCGAKVASALAAEPRPRQHLIQKQFLAPLTAPRCPLLGSHPPMNSSEIELARFAAVFRQRCVKPLAAFWQKRGKPLARNRTENTPTCRGVCRSRNRAGSLRQSTCGLDQCSCASWLKSTEYCID